MHDEEAKIIADAGVPGAVTIATNMAGRGTDIQLGGNLEMRLAEAAQKKPLSDAARSIKLPPKLPPQNRWRLMLAGCM